MGEKILSVSVFVREGEVEADFFSRRGVGFSLRRRRPSPWRAWQLAGFLLNRGWRFRPWLGSPEETGWVAYPPA
jgi:hypothetical protein